MHHIVKRLMTVILLLTLCLLCLSGCGRSTSTAPFSYVEKDFFLTVEGKLCLKHEAPTASETLFLGKIRTGQPLSFEARITVRPLSSGEVYDSPSLAPPLWQIQISYTAPEALAGLSVSCLYNRQVSAFETQAEATLTYTNTAGQLSVKLPYTSVATLCFPATSLLPCHDVVSVSPTAGGLKTITVADDISKIVYTFSEDSIYPLQIEIISDKSEATLLIISAS